MPTTLKNEKEISGIFNALGDPNRLRIFKLLLGPKEPCVSEIARILDLSVPAISQQLRILELSGLVRKERRGQMTCYRVKTEDPVVKNILKLTT
jgi:DNA-binding transcriptional ArsR family regulator